MQYRLQLKPLAPTIHTSPGFYMSADPTKIISCFFSPSHDLSLTSAPACTHLPILFSHTEVWQSPGTGGLIKADNCHEQHFKGPINQPAQAQQPAAAWLRPTPRHPFQEISEVIKLEVGSRKIKEATLHHIVSLVFFFMCVLPGLYTHTLQLSWNLKKTPLLPGNLTKYKRS